MGTENGFGEARYRHNRIGRQALMAGFEGKGRPVRVVPGTPEFRAGVRVGRPFEAARVAFKRSAYLRNFVYTFAELLSSRLTRETVDRAMAGHLNDADL